MDVQQLKEIEKWVMGAMGVVLLVMWLFVKWALRKSKELEEEDGAEEVAKCGDDESHPCFKSECANGAQIASVDHAPDRIYGEW